jgi:hypothetical protein
MLVAAFTWGHSGGRPEPSPAFRRSSLEREIRVLPVIGKVGGNMGVNGQLEKMGRGVA